MIHERPFFIIILTIIFLLKRKVLKKKLLNFLCQFVAKVLSNRLQMVIGSVISETQTAFVKDKQILDGILIANEVVDEG
jgi:proline dehydrogenase